MHYELNENHFMTSKTLKGGKILEYFTSEERRHREDGPAKIAISNFPSNEYLEWWNNGKLVASFDRNRNIMLKVDNNGEFSKLIEVKVPNKWKGLERTLTLHDIAFCNEVKLNKESILSNFSEIRSASFKSR